MNAITPINALASVRQQYARLTEAQQFSLLSDLLQGAHGLEQSEEWLDALCPVTAAFEAHCDTLARFVEDDATSGWTPSEGDTRYWSDADMQRVFGGVR